MNVRMFLVAVAAFVVPHCAYGQYWCGSPYGWPGGCGPVYSTYCTESVPYYALNPPVYYSSRVPRTYGYSPFPYPPGVLTPGSEPPRSVVVRNAYAPTEGVADAGTEPSQSRPLRINNPYVEQPGKAAKASKPASHRPQVVYPASLARFTK
jgi:hypothetical protein